MNKKILFGIFLILFLGCNSEIKEEEVICKDCNVILLSLDTLRADHLGVYGYDKNTSPNIDRFSAESILFRNMYSNSYNTIPSHMSIFTGLYPLETGVTNVVNLPNTDFGQTFAEIMRDNDYQTVWYGSMTSPSAEITKVFYRGFQDIHQGAFIRNLSSVNFSFINNDTGKFFLFLHSYINHAPYIYSDYNSDENGIMFNEKYTQESANERLPKDRTEMGNYYFQYIKKRYKADKTQFLQDFRYENLSVISETFETNDFNGFIQLHKSSQVFPDNGYHLNHVYFDSIINNPTNQEIEFLSKSYDNGVYYSDYLVGLLIEELKSSGLYNNTILIITSDHGEQLYEHLDFDHGTFFEHTTRVPLIIHVPGVTPIIVDQLFESVDIMPTVLSFLGIKHHNKRSGNIIGKEGEFVYGNNFGVYYIRNKTHKLIKTADSNLYYFDLVIDPEEKINLYNGTNRMEKELDKWISQSLV